MQRAALQTPQRGTYLLCCMTLCCQQEELQSSWAPQQHMAPQQEPHLVQHRQAQARLLQLWQPHLLLLRLRLM